MLKTTFLLGCGGRRKPSDSIAHGRADPDASQAELGLHRKSLHVSTAQWVLLADLLPAPRPVHVTYSALSDFSSWVRALS